MNFVGNLSTPFLCFIKMARERFSFFLWQVTGDFPFPLTAAYISFVYHLTGSGSVTGSGVGTVFLLDVPTPRDILYRR